MSDDERGDEDMAVGDAPPVPDASPVSDASPVPEAPPVAWNPVTGVARVDDLDAFLEAVDAVGEETGAVVQVLDARYVVSREHLDRAVRHAARALARGENVARDPAVEVLLYAAGRRQIDRALAMGVGEGEVPAVAVVADFGEVPNVDAGTADLDAASRRVRELLGGDVPAGDEGGDGQEAFDRADPDLVREFFDVTDRELAATDGDLADVVAERVALLDVEK